jgi:hypothetical protein
VDETSNLRRHHCFECTAFGELIWRTERPAIDRGSPASRKALCAYQVQRLRLNQSPPVEDAVETGSAALRECKV